MHLHPYKPHVNRWKLVSSIFFKILKWCENMHTTFFIAIHYDTFKISNISSGFEVLITMTVYYSAVQ